MLGVGKDLLKMENSHESNSNNNPLVSFLEKETVNTNLRAGHRSRKNMSQPSDLFRKYLLDKPHRSAGKVNSLAAEANKSKPTRRGLFPPQDSTTSFWKAYFLEQELFPKIRSNQAPTMKNQSSKGQLTIFYSGAINVYDNVPVDKAQTIMLLAEESSSRNTSALKTATTDESKVASPPQPSCLLSVNKLQPVLAADLPIARKHSLQRFLEKRRERILNKSPYASTTVKRDVDEAFMSNHTFSSPSPLSAPMSAHMAGQSMGKTILDCK